MSITPKELRVAQDRHDRAVERIQQLTADLNHANAQVASVVALAADVEALKLDVAAVGATPSPPVSSLAIHRTGNQRAAGWQMLSPIWLTPRHVRVLGNHAPETLPTNSTTRATRSRSLRRIC